jgi:hypothetical protein
VRDGALPLDFQSFELVVPLLGGWLERISLEPACRVIHDVNYQPFSIFKTDHRAGHDSDAGRVAGVLELSQCTFYF